MLSCCDVDMGVNIYQVLSKSGTYFSNADKRTQITIDDHVRRPLTVPAQLASTKTKEQV